jgi:hypothetical protein
MTCSEYKLASLPPDRLRMKIVDDIFTLKCPRCYQAFLDFDGCFALKCSSCPCNFCGWCLEDCGTDAHPHVKSCKQKPKTSDSYFGTKEQFIQGQNERRKNLLLKFLEDYSSDKKKIILQSIQTDLEDLQINI